MIASVGMIALFLLLSAQAAAAAPADTSPAAPPARKVCRQEPGSQVMLCTLSPQQQSGYRLPRFGPGAPKADDGRGVRLRAQASNRNGRRNRSMATVGIPF